MRRLLFIWLLVAGVLLTLATTATAAVGPYAATLTWGSIPFTGVTGYNALLNGSQVGSTTGGSYTFTSLACGTSVTLAVQPHNGSGGTGLTYSVPYSTPACPSPFPLQVLSGSRFIETSAYHPWLMEGDSPWTLFAENSCGTITNGVCASGSTVSNFLADREAKGFNTVLVALLCTTYTFCGSSGQTYDGVAPFTSGTTPATYTFGSGQCGNCNATYFARAHAVAETALQDGIVMMFDPIETGGWLTTLENNGDGTVSTTDADYRYGQYLGNEFKDLPNVMWMSGNDFDLSSLPSAADDNDALTVANGIANTDPTALQTVEFNYWSSKSTDESAWSSRLNLDGVYVYRQDYSELNAAYTSSPTLPTFLEESNYEAENNGSGADGCAGGGVVGTLPTAAQLIQCRVAEWWTATAGTTGQLYGNYYTDSVGCGCGHSGGPVVASNGYTASNIDTLGVTQLGYVTSFLDGLKWWNLQPDSGHTLLYCGSSGTGCGTCTGGVPSSDSCVTDSADSFTAGQTTEAIAYIPSPSGFTSVTIDLADFAGNVTAKWYDPTNNSYQTISGSPFTNSGSHTFTPTANNNAGSPDWVLLLQG